MERRLLRYIMTPAMIVTCCSAGLVLSPGASTGRQLVPDQARAGAGDDRDARAFQPLAQGFRHDRNRAPAKFYR